MASENDNPEDDNPAAEDPVEKAIGKNGKYQMLICCALFVSKLPMAFHQIAIVFLTPPVTFYCGDRLNSCPCKNPKYDKSIFSDTIIMSWDLICERRFLANLDQTFLMLGALFGSISFGTISDRYGRRYPLLGTVVLQLVAVLVSTQANSVWFFTYCRFFIGVATGGSMVITFVMMMEITSKDNRETLSALYQLPFNIGHLLLAGIGYLFRDWRIFQAMLAIPTILMLAYYWIIPESPRWLLAVGKTDRAIAVLEKIARANKLPTENIANDINKYQNTKPVSLLHKGTILDLFRTPNLRKKTIYLSLSWLVCGFGYLGLTHYVSKLSGDIFLNVALSAVVTIPGTLLAIILLHKFGRKTLLVAMFVASACCLFPMAVIPPSASIVKVLLACAGGVDIFICFIVIYLFTSETFPTVVRNAGLGLASMSARIGSMVAPYVAGLDEEITWLPPVIFGSMSVLGAFLCTLLPETKGTNLLTTIEEAEEFGKNE